jgi:hypothetical protein
MLAPGAPAMKRRSAIPIVLIAGLLLGTAAVAEEIVELIPKHQAGLSHTNLFAPIASLFVGPGYWYKQREIQIETVPEGAVLDLFYIRASFQKAYEQAESPVTVRLPSRVEAGKRDVVTIRALLDGYQQKEIRVPVRSRQTKVVIELAPLANSLLAVSHPYLADRGTLSFSTSEALAFRMQENPDGFSVVMNGTGVGIGADETMAGVESPLVKSLRPQQLGEDLVVRVTLMDAAQKDAVQVRSRQSFDPVRGVHKFSLDLIPADGGVDSVNRAKSALARIQPHAVTGCSLVFDRSLRERLDFSDLSRALAADGSFTDPYLREAMKRLGQLSDGGVITMTDGTRFLVSAPMELMAAASRGAEAVGYLAILRAFVAELEPPESRRQALRGLIAPEMAPARFDSIADAAQTAERLCRQGDAS